MSPSEVPKAASDVYSAEVCRRARKASCTIVAERVAKNEATLDIVSNEVCHICHNRKASGITFHCGRHTYCDFHLAVSMSTVNVVRAILSFWKRYRHIVLS